ncbi:hypothetical protein ACFC1T_08670 [Kitasatospora sp. NPDC056076]|uniref:hypothetical protein n=1 Tax=Kitasatospora sp. NPDC056076 TaxID=3345703 RepID=UPI0035DA9AB2
MVAQQLDNQETGNQLGCPQRYSAAVMWRGGTKTFIPAADIVDAAESISFDRRLNESSHAVVKVSRIRARRDCCALLGRVEPGVHELIVYRDRTPVWCGPVTIATQTADTFTIEARDVSAWLARLVNTVSLPFGIPDGAFWDIARVAESCIRGNLNFDPYSNPHDYPNMLSYLLTYDTGIAWNSGRRDSWYVYVLDIINNLASKGFEWTVLKRAMMIRPVSNTTVLPGQYWKQRQATLQADDLGGDVTVSRNWDSIATRVFASDQTNQYKGIAVTYGSDFPAYGRLDTLVTENVNPSDQDTPREVAILRDLAVNTYNGLVPPRVSFTVGTNARLRPQAPITMERLVPGNRVDVLFNDYCQPINQSMKIVMVSAAWDGNSETVGVTLVPLH